MCVLLPPPAPTTTTVFKCVCWRGSPDIDLTGLVLVSALQWVFPHPSPTQPNPTCWGLGRRRYPGLMFVS